jgi:hypothetical protein
MGGRLTRLSDTRWRYHSGRWVYFIRQVQAPNEYSSQPGLYWVDGGADHTGTVTADSIERVVEELREDRPVVPW